MVCIQLIPTKISCYYDVICIFESIARPMDSSIKELYTEVESGGL